MVDVPNTSQFESLASEEASFRAQGRLDVVAAVNDLRRHLEAHQYLADGATLSPNAPNWIRAPFESVLLLAEKTLETPDASSESDVHALQESVSRIIAELRPSPPPLLVRDSVVPEPPLGRTSEARTVSASDEYKAAYDNWRFLVGSRFVILGTFFTTFGGIAFLAKEFLSAEAQGRYGHVRFLAAFATAAAGFLVSLQLHKIEFRFRLMYTSCIDRAEELEKPNGLGSRLTTDPKKFQFRTDREKPSWHVAAMRYGSHSGSLDSLFRAAYVIWVSLAIVSGISAIASW